MANGWSGATPSANSEPGTDYELGTKYRAESDITISQVRVWSPAGSGTYTNRNAYIRTAAGTILATIDLPDTLSAGYTLHSVVPPLEVAATTVFWLDYSTVSTYGAVVDAGMPLLTGDGHLTLLSGGFNTDPPAMPNVERNNFYGIDIVYEGPADPNVPVVGITANATGMAATAMLTIDDNNPSSVTYRIEWNDGTFLDTVSLGPHQHTYTGLSRAQSILVTATDGSGNVDSASAAVFLRAPTNETTSANENWIDPIFDAVVSDVQRSGYFDKVNRHEPKRKPKFGLSAAVWVQAIDPIPLASGLAATSARLLFIVRIYVKMLSEPQDDIDPNMVRAASNIIRRYHDDFDFEGLIRNVDLLGQFGIALASQAGYLEMDNTHYRIMDITVPCIVNNVWPQVKAVS
jgi:hypothetical protein